MLDHCESATEDGNAICLPGTCGCSSSAKSSEPVLLSLPSLSENKNATPQKIIQFNPVQEKTMWKKIRSGLTFVVACLTSPCCTPIIVPIGLALLAGTPVAVWLSANINWVYGVLSLISIVSFVLFFRQIGQRVGQKAKSKLSIESARKAAVQRD